MFSAATNQERPERKGTKPFGQEHHLRLQQSILAEHKKVLEQLATFFCFQVFAIYGSDVLL